MVGPLTAAHSLVVLVLASLATLDLAFHSRSWPTNETRTGTVGIAPTSLGRAATEQTQAMNTTETSLKTSSSGKLQSSLGEVTAHVEDKLGSRHHSIVRRYDYSSLMRLKADRLRQVDVWRFQVSPGVYKGRIYLILRLLGRRNLQLDNQACEKYRGYLVELGDHQEYTYLHGVLSRIGWTFYTTSGGSAPVRYYTGGNDLATEGRFVYCHSKTAVPKGLPWVNVTPGYSRDNRDCMVMNKHALNARRCDGFGAFVCEIPLI